jgi:hypothetical protein
LTSFHELELINAIHLKQPPKDHVFEKKPFHRDAD